MSVTPIFKQGETLFASIARSLTDTEMIALRDELAVRIAETRATGVVIDLTALDVLDSFACGTLRGIAAIARLRGASTVLVGIQPAVAFAMTQLGLRFDDLTTALDLDDALDELRRRRV